MKKRLFTLLFAIVLMVGLLSGTVISAYATESDAVASINTTEYTDLQAALTAATDGDTVKLLKDVKTGALTIEKKEGTEPVTLDLNGHTMTVADENAEYGININWNLVVKGGSLIVNTPNADNAISAWSKGNGLTVINADVTATALHQGICVSDTITVDGGTVKATATAENSIGVLSRKLIVTKGTVEGT